MNIFKCTLEELAVDLARDTNLFNNAINFLNYLNNKKISNEKINNSLEEEIKFLKDANNLARESDYFAFRVFDSWAEQEGNGYGYVLYQKVNKKLIEKLGLTSNGPNELEEIYNFLKEKKIKVIYTTHITKKGYFGLENVMGNEDGDFFEKDTIKYSFLNSEDINDLILNGIEVIHINN